jgi:hypothetical protein
MGRWRKSRKKLRIASRLARPATRARHVRPAPRGRCGPALAARPLAGLRPGSQIRGFGNPSESPGHPWTRVHPLAVRRFVGSSPIASTQELLVERTLKLSAAPEPACTANSRTGFRSLGIRYLGDPPRLLGRRPDAALTHLRGIPVGPGHFLHPRPGDGHRELFP